MSWAEWLTVFATFLGGGVLGSIITVYIRGTQEYRSDLRKNLLKRGEQFSTALQAALEPTRRALELRSEEPDEDEETAARRDDEDEDFDPREHFSIDMMGAHGHARTLVRAADAACPPLLLLLEEDSVAVRAAIGAVGALGGCLGAALEPEDESNWGRLYLLRAELQWVAFNRAVRVEMLRAGNESQLGSGVANSEITISGSATKRTNAPWSMGA